MHTKRKEIMKKFEMTVYLLLTMKLIDLVNCHPFIKMKNQKGIHLI